MTKETITKYEKAEEKWLNFVVPIAVAFLVWAVFATIATVYKISF